MNPIRQQSLNDIIGIRDMTLALYKSVDNLQIHLTSLCEWYVRVEKDGRIREFISETIEESLQEALNYKWLPQVPTKPLRYEYTIQKGADGQYHCFRNGNWMFKIKTKSEANEYLARYISRDEEVIKKWEEEYSWSIGKTEGVDFEYKR